MALQAHILAVEGADVEGLGLLGGVRVHGALVYAQAAEDLTEQGPARQHALDRLLDDALRETAVEDRLRRALLDSARIAGVAVVDLLLALAAREHHLFGVDDDDVVAAVDVGCVGGLVLAAQTHGDDRGEAADDQPLRVDHNPLLIDLGGFSRSGLHRAAPPCAGAPGPPSSEMPNRRAKSAAAM